MSDEPHWLSPAEQHAWRSFVRLHQKLFATMGRDLQAQAKLSGADFEVLVALTDTAEGRQRFQDLAKTIDWEQSRLSHLPIGLKRHWSRCFPWLGQACRRH